MLVEFVCGPRSAPYPRPYRGLVALSNRTSRSVDNSCGLMRGSEARTPIYRDAAGSARPSSNIGKMSFNEQPSRPRPLMEENLCHTAFVGRRRRRERRWNDQLGAQRSRVPATCICADICIYSWATIVARRVSRHDTTALCARPLGFPDVPITGNHQQPICPTPIPDPR